MIAIEEDLRLEYWLRKRNSGRLVWRTRTGDEIPIKDLSDKHLVNILDMFDAKYDYEIDKYQYNELLANLDDAMG